MAFSLLAHKLATGGTSATTAGVDTTGASLLVAVVATSVAGTLSVSDSKGNTWNSLTAQAANVQAQIFYVENPVVGTAHTATASNSASSAVKIEFLAYSGSATSSVFDVENGASSPFAATTSIQTGSVTPSQDGSLIVTGIDAANNGTLSIDAGFSIIDQSTANFNAGGFAHLIQATRAAVNPTWNYTAAGRMATAIAVFKPAAGGGSVTVEAVSGSLAIIGQTGDVSATANKTARAASGSLSIVGQTGHVAANANIAVEASPGSVGITGSVPAVHATANRSIKATAGSVSITGSQGAVATSTGKVVHAISGGLRIVGAGCRVQVTSSASVEANAGRLSIRGQVANVSTRSKSMGDDAGRRYSQWAPRGTRPIRVVYDEEDVREALGEPEAKAAPKPTKAKKRKLVKNVERKVLAAASLPEAFAPRIEWAVAQEVGTAWRGPSDWEVLSAILNVAAQKAVEEIQRIQAEIEEEDEMILLLAA